MIQEFRRDAEIDCQSGEFLRVVHSQDEKKAEDADMLQTE